MVVTDTTHYMPRSLVEELGMIDVLSRGRLEAGREPRLLHTIRGVGYVLRAPRG